MNISLVALTCASLVEVRLEVHVRIPTRSYADVVADAEADWIRTKNNMTSSPSVGVAKFDQDWPTCPCLRCPCYNVYTTGKRRVSQQSDNWV